MRSLNSQGCAREDNTKALEELHRRHSSHQLPEWTDPLTAPLCPDSDFVLEILKKFSRSSSPTSTAPAICNRGNHSSISTGLS